MTRPSRPWIVPLPVSVQCPHCEEVRPHIVRADPVEGDWSICITCGGLAVHTRARPSLGALILRQATPEEHVTASLDPQVAILRSSLAATADGPIVIGDWVRYRHGIDFNHGQVVDQYHPGGNPNAELRFVIAVDGDPTQTTAVPAHEVERIPR